MTTKARGGAIAGYPFEIDITVIIYMPIITRKYRLAIFFVNCSNKLIGIKDKIEYLEVRTVLFLTSRRLRKAVSES